jgi:hypothetical protein
MYIKILHIVADKFKEYGFEEFDLVFESKDRMTFFAQNKEDSMSIDYWKNKDGSEELKINKNIVW